MAFVELTSLLLMIAIVGGFLSGLLGIGGGLIFVPALYFCLTHFGVDEAYVMRIAVGTSLALVTVTSASSAYWHHKKGAIDFGIVKSWSLFIVAGVAVGAFFASSVDGVLLKKLFAGVTLLIASYMAFSKEQSHEPEAHRVDKKIQCMIVSLIGFISSMIGIGGAMLNIPFMTYIGIPMRRAVGTGAVLGFIIALPAMVSYILTGFQELEHLPPYSLGYVNAVAVGIIIPVSMLVSPLGVHVSHLTPRNRLRRIFALVLIVVSIRMFMAH